MYSNRPPHCYCLGILATTTMEVRSWQRVGALWLVVSRPTNGQFTYFYFSSQVSSAFQVKAAHHGLLKALSGFHAMHQSCEWCFLPSLNVWGTLCLRHMAWNMLPQGCRRSELQPGEFHEHFTVTCFLCRPLKSNKRTLHRLYSGLYLQSEFFQVFPSGNEGLFFVWEIPFYLSVFLKGFKSVGNSQALPLIHD